jgi:hypothetical protein
MIKCQHICQLEYQEECQIECQNMSEYMSGRISVGGYHSNTGSMGENVSSNIRK